MSSSDSSSEDDRCPSSLALVFIFNAFEVSDAEVRTLPGLAGCSVVERREFGVQLQPGLTPSDRTANVLVCMLAVVRGAVKLKLGVPHLAGAVCKPKTPIPGFRRSSVVLVANKVSGDVLSAVVESSTLSMEDLPSLAAHFWPLMKACRAAAEAQLNEIKRYMYTHNLQSKKPFERDQERARELLRNLQRLANIARLQEDASVRLSACPLQLGFGSVDQWLHAADDCRTVATQNSKRELADMLKVACSCGLLSWKLRRQSGSCISQPFLARELLRKAVIRLTTQLPGQ